MSRAQLLSFVVVLVLGVPGWAAGAEPACVGWIAVESEGATGGEILLDGKGTGLATPATLKDVPCGPHRVEVRLPLHESAQRTVEVRAGEVAKVSLALTSSAGELAVTTEPAGASVEVDGVQVGKSPWSGGQVARGLRVVRVSLADHRTVEKTIAVSPGKKATLAIRLSPEFGRLDVVSLPEPDGLVSLDGDALGPAPISLSRVPLGVHTVRVTRELYLPFEAKVEVRAGEAEKVVANLKSDHGSLKLDSVPTGGRVLLDGKPAGTTPVVLKARPGEHLVRVEAADPGHDASESRQVFRVGERRELKLVLPARVGSLMIDCVPYAAEIQVDGIKRGKAPVSIKEILVGPHVIIAEAPGQAPLVGRIEVVEGQTSVAEINLKEPDKSTYKTPPPGTRVAAVKPAPAVKPEPRTEAKPAPKPEAKPEAEAKPAPEAEPAKSGEAREVVEATPKVQAGEVDTTVTAREAAPVTWQRIAFWTSVGLGAAGLITSAVMFGIGVDTQADGDAAYEAWRRIGTEALREKYLQLDEDAATQLNAGWGCLGVGLAFGGAAVAFWLLEPEPQVDRSGPQDGLGLAPLPGGAWLGYSLHF